MYKLQTILCKTKIGENKMQFSDIKPFIRFARYMKLTRDAEYPVTVPCDARFFFVTEGEGELFVGGEGYSMKCGDVMLFPAGTPYRLCPGAPEITYILFNFDFTYGSSSLSVPVPPKLQNDFSARDVIEPASFDCSDLPMPLYLTGMDRLSPRLEKIVREYSRKYLHYEIKISGIFSDVLTSCMRARQASPTGAGQAKIEEILKYVYAHRDKSLTNISLAERFGFHPNYVSTLVKSYTGIPLHRYLLTVRLSRAAELITQTELSLSEISEMCGFCDIYYFSRYFKRTFGTPPSEYRRKNAGI